MNDDLLRRAAAMTGLTETPALIDEALKSLIERESARKLANMGGIDPDAVIPPRRRSWDQD